MRTKGYASFAVLAALAGLSVTANADTFRYSVDLGSGQEPVGYAVGGQPFLQIASAATANGWQSRFAIQPCATPYFHEFNMNLYSDDSDSMFAAIGSHFSTPNYSLFGSVLAVDVTTTSFSKIQFSGFFNKVAFPSLSAGSSDTAPIALGITPWAEPSSVYHPVGSPPAGPTSSLAGFSQGNVDVRIDGHDAHALAVSSITVTSNEYANSIFGLTKDCSDLVVTVPETVSVAQAHYGSLGSNVNATVVYHGTGGGGNYRLTLKGLVFRTVAPTQLTDSLARHRSTVFFTVQSASFGPA